MRMSYALHQEIEGRSYARPPPAFKVLSRNRGFTAWCYHAQPLFNEDFELSDQRRAVQDLC